MPGHRKIRRAIYLSILLLVAFHAASLAAEMEEYRLKSLFLYNFAQFVDWPPGAFRGESGPMEICVLGSSAFERELKSVLAGKTTATGRPINTRQISGSKQSAGCHILFVSASVQSRFSAMPADLSRPGLLTVGESKGFAAEGGTINFKLVGSKLKIEVNLRAAEERHLRFSSKLLALAEVVNR